MADFRENQSGLGDSSSDDASLDLIEAIKQLALSWHTGKTRLTYEEMLFSLKRWWCHHYERPYKDPLLDSYTFEELIFEYYDIEGPEKEGLANKEKMIDDDRDWAAEEEAKELAEEEAAEAAALAAEEAAEAASESDNITEESDDAAWAAKYEPPAATLINPNPDQSDDGGDIKSTFGV